MAVSGVSDREVLDEAIKSILESAQSEEASAGELNAAVAVVPPRARAPEDENIKRAASRLWLVSFTDLFSLMLCFFVLLYAMKDPDLEKIGNLSGKVATGAREAQHKGFSGGDNQAVNISRVAYGEALNLDYLEGVLKNVIKQAKLDGDVKITQARNYLNLTIDDGKVFAGGNALSAGGAAIAKGLAASLSRLSNRITVVAVPSSSGDWAQGIVQAEVFGEMMRDGGYRKPFTVLADGSGRGIGIEIRVEADDGQLR